MKEYWYSIKDRAVDSAAVWEHGAASFAVGELTLEMHKTDIASLNATLLAQYQAALALGTARADRDASYRTIANLCMRACQVVHGSLPPEEPLRAEVRHVRGARQESQAALLGKGQRLVSLWQKVNAHRAALAPPQPALLVGTTDLAAFRQMLLEHPPLLQSVEDMLSAMKTRKAAMRALVSRLDRNNKRWFEAWKGQFPADSQERELLRQISTGPKRHEPSRAVVLSVEVMADGRVRLAFDAARGTSFTVLHRGPGETEFAPLAEKIREKTFVSEPLPAGAHAWQVIAHNSAGDGPASGEAVIPLRLDSRVKPGEPFATFHAAEVFLNQLTSPHRDNVAMTPEYKVVAVSVQRS